MNTKITIDSMVENTEKSIAYYERHLAWALKQAENAREQIKKQREHLAFLKNHKENSEAAKQ